MRLEVLLNLAGVFTGSNDLTNLSQDIAIATRKVFADGNGADQANRFFSDTRTLAASATEDLDLVGSLTDAFGAAFSPSKIKAILIRAAAANVNDVVVGGAASNAVSTIFGATTDKVKVKPGGVFFLMAPDSTGYGLTAATADLLKIANSGAGTSVTYDIVVVAAV